MKFKFALLLFLTFFLGCKKKKDAPATPSTHKSAMDYLTNGSSKDWKITATYPLDIHPSCNASSPMNQDNTITFKSDSTYIFNHGSIIVDPDDSYCSDPVNYSGVFKLIDGGTKIILKITYLTDSNTPDTSDPADTASIAKLNDNTLILFEKDGTTTDSTVFSKK